MTLTERPISHKVLLVDDDDAVREMMRVTLNTRVSRGRCRECGRCFKTNYNKEV